jgi:precorrin-2 dehydrogenase/sirohydrochlorin ferrochelatase
VGVPPGRDGAAAPAGVPLLILGAGLRVCCVGGGPVAERKLAGLLDAGASVVVVAPEATDGLVRAATEGRVTWQRRAYAPGDLGDAHLVIAGTGDAAVNATVAADADAAGRLCVRVDDGIAGTAAMMGAVHRPPLVLGVATTVGAPALSRQLRRELAQRYGPEHGRLALLVAELRADERVVAALTGLDAGQRRARWRAAMGPDILAFIRAGQFDQAKEAAYACLLSSLD